MQLIVAVRRRSRLVQMTLLQTKKSGFAKWIVAGVILAAPVACLGMSQDGKGAVGKLRLQGKSIETLVLRRNDGRQQEIQNPQETMELPLGHYRVHEIRLKGGYNGRIVSSRPRDRFEISEDKPASLKIGGPLKQTIRTRRQGRMLELSYGLVGIGGETYSAVRSANNRPAFAIYKGDRELAKGDFEFG